METSIFSWYSYLLIFLILFSSMIIGVYFGCCRKGQNGNEYLLAGRKMKPIPIAISLTASVSTSELLLGISTDVYRYGASLLLENFSFVIVFFITIFIYMPVFSNLKVTTTYEYLEMRFDRRMRQFASFSFCLYCILYLSLPIYVPSLALSTVTGMRTHFVVVIVSGICIIYTTIGGLRTVIWTDTLQFVLIVTQLFTVLILGIGVAGSLFNIWTKAVESNRLDIFQFDPNPTRRDSVWIIIIGLTFSVMSFTSVDQAINQKLLSVPTFKESVRAFLYFILGFIIYHLICISLGLILYAKYGDCDPFSTGKIQRNDQLLLLLVLEISEHYPGVTSIFIIGLFCSSLSSQSAYINAVAGTICEDFLSKFLNANVWERKADTILKLTVVAVGLTSTSLIFVVEILGDIFPMIVGLTGLILGPILGSFTLGMLFPKANATGAFYGTICGLLATISIVAPATYYQAQGLLSYPTKLLSVEACPMNVTTSNNSTMDLSPSQEIPSIFRISFYYYSMIATLITMIVGLIISYATDKNTCVDRKLLSPAYLFLFSDKETDNSVQRSSDEMVNLTASVNIS